MNSADKSISNSDFIMPEFEETFSEIFLMSYSYSPGGISVFMPKRERSLAYCIEPPHQVFEELYPDYVVTNYKGFDFFNEENLEQGDKAYGLGINKIEPVFAGGVRLEKVLTLEYLEELKRSSSKSKQETQKFLLEIKDNRMCLANLSKRLSEKGIKEFYENQRKGPSRKIDFF